MQAPVPGAPFFTENRRIQTLPVVPNEQLKLPFIVPDFHFDLPRLRMVECIS